MGAEDLKYWSIPSKDVMDFLSTDPDGLSEEKAQDRLAEQGENLIAAQRKTTELRLLLEHFKIRSS